MKNLARWALFTLATAAAFLALALGMLFLGRTYVTLQSPAFLLVMLVAFSAAVTIAASAFAANLDEERRGRTSRSGRARTDTDA